MNGFISCTHDDHDLCKKLKDHLDLSKDHGGADFWVDSNRLLAGDQWSVKIAKAIDAAEIFLLLVSVQSLHSAYIWDVEWPRIQEQEARCEGLVVSVILRRCTWEFRFGAYQAAPTIGGRVRPIGNWHPRNDGCHVAHEQVLAAIRARTARLAGGSP